MRADDDELLDAKLLQIAADLGAKLLELLEEARVEEGGTAAEVELAAADPLVSQPCEGALGQLRGIRVEGAAGEEGNLVGRGAAQLPAHKLDPLDVV